MSDVNDDRERATVKVQVAVQFSRADMDAYSPDEHDAAYLLAGYIGRERTPLATSLVILVPPAEVADDPAYDTRPAYSPVLQHYVVNAYADMYGGNSRAMRQ